MNSPPDQASGPLFSGTVDLDFEKYDGLVPTVIQHAGNGLVLMLGYMNREALDATIKRRRVVFFSRARKRLWEKGETSGHTLEPVNITMDCDRDALLITTRPRGPTCHTGRVSCFEGLRAAPIGSYTFLEDLEHLIDERIQGAVRDSYTARLVLSGTGRIAQKVGEEALEVALAAVSGSNAEMASEAADLLYHLIVLLRSRGVSLGDVIAELRRRAKHLRVKPVVEPT